MGEMEMTEQGSRPMPDFVKRGLVRVKSGQLYLKVPFRVLWMRHEHPEWSIVTGIEYADYEAGFVVMRATIMDGEGRVLATSHKEGKRDPKFPLIEKTESGAIARALGLCGYGTEYGELGEDDEQGTPEQGAAAPATNGGAVKVAGDKACAVCHAPAGKNHATGCTAAK